LQLIKGVIFPTYEYKEFISKIEIQAATTSRLDTDPYVTIWLSMDRS